jgi:uncharacterized protein YabN with tetrapyrrole methylase and pyrophosphatase domain
MPVCAQLQAGLPERGIRMTEGDNATGGGCAFHDAWRLQENASNSGFDWPDISGVIEKIEEELGELRAALAKNDREEARDETGDLFFAAVNLCRFLDIHPENAVRRTNERFTQRFEKVCRVFESEGRDMKTCALDELDAVWDAVKLGERQQLEKGS